MGNKTGSVRKLDNDSDSDEEPIAVKNTSIRKNAQPSKGCDTEPTNRRRSSGGNGDSSSSSTAATSKKKSSSLLSEHQKQLISRSWKQHVNRHSTENIGVRIFFNIFEISPEIKQIFGYDNTMTREMLLFDKRFQRQAKAFIRVIDEAVRDIENLEEEVQNRLHALGARHVKFRSASGAFKMQHWDTFAEAMLESIIDSQRGVHKYRDTTATWRIFITWIIGIMKQGYYETLRAERRATTAGLPHPLVDPPPPVYRQGTVSMSAPGSSGISPAAPNYSRNHSVSYAHTDLIRQLHPPPRTASPSPHSQQLLEPITASSRSAPHSPYVVKTPPRHYPSASHQAPSGNLLLPYESYPKRSLVSADISEQHQQLITTHSRGDQGRGNLLYRNYEYEEEREYEEEDDAPLQDENYPSKHYYSDYY